MGIRKEPWEVKEIDLNLRHYSGHPADVMKKVKSDIERYLSNTEVSEEQRKVYSAVYNALEYYSDVSYIQPAEFATDDSFLSCAIHSFNDDFRYLSQKYNPKDPTKPPVIDFSARIKSPASFVEKMKEKITEYLEQGRDLGYFNESLRDLLGARITINPPQRVKDKGPEAECDFLYRVMYDLMDNHGISIRNQTSLSPGNYRFINVNTRHDKLKMKRIQERVAKEGYAPGVTDGENPIYVPQKRIPEIEKPYISSKIKDYVRYPKYSGYQSLHICVTPDFSNYMEHPELPACIIPPSTYDFFLEYQFRTQRQNDFAEHGIASHKTSYKPDQLNYHRLSVPFYIEMDGPHDIADNSYGRTVARKPVAMPASKKLKLRNFAESYERFYGHTFQDRFGLSFKDFRDSFSTEQRNEILSQKKSVEYDEETGIYHLVPFNRTLVLTEEQQMQLETFLRSKTNSKELQALLDELGFLDNMLSPETQTKADRTRKRIPISLVLPTSTVERSFETKQNPAILDIPVVESKNDSQSSLDDDL